MLENQVLSGGPVVKTPCSQCRGPRLHSSKGTKISMLLNNNNKKSLKDTDLGNSQ